MGTTGPLTIETLRPSARDLYDHLTPRSRQSATTRDVRDVMLATDGRSFYAGTLYSIRSRRIGPGVHEVWLEASSCG